MTEAYELFQLETCNNASFKRHCCDQNILSFAAIEALAVDSVAVYGPGGLGVQRPASSDDVLYSVAGIVVSCTHYQDEIPKSVYQSAELVPVARRGRFAVYSNLTGWDLGGPVYVVFSGSDKGKIVPNDMDGTAAELPGSQLLQRPGPCIPLVFQWQPKIQPAPAVAEFGIATESGDLLTSEDGNILVIE